MDADDDRYNGCVTKINQGKCHWGSCQNHGVTHGQQCGAWKGLICDETTENSCCTCDESKNLNCLNPVKHCISLILDYIENGCIAEEVMKEKLTNTACGEQCEVACDLMTENRETLSFCTLDDLCAEESGATVVGHETGSQSESGEYSGDNSDNESSSWSGFDYDYEK